MSAQTVTVKPTDGREWNGNGMGHTPATYGVFVAGGQIATIAHNGSGPRSWGVYEGAPTRGPWNRIARLGDRISPTGWMTFAEARAWARAWAAGGAR